MDAKSILLTGVTMALVPAVQNAALEEPVPACGIETVPKNAAPLACREKQPPPQHVERDTLPPMYQPTIGVTVTPTYQQPTGFTISATQ
jgi:hypothetical protein